MKNNIVYVLLFNLAFLLNVSASVYKDVGVKLNVYPSAQIPSDFLFLLKENITEVNELFLIEHRRRYEESMEVDLNFPFLLYDQYSLKVELYSSKGTHRTLHIVPQNKLESNQREIIHFIVKTILIEAGIKKGKRLGRNTLDNIHFFPKTKGDLSLNIIGKGHEYAVIKETDSKDMFRKDEYETLREEHSIKKRYKTIDYQNETSYTTNRDKNILNKIPYLGPLFLNVSEDKVSYSESFNTGLASLSTELNLNEFKLPKGKTEKKSLSIAFSNEDHSFRYGIRNVKIDGTLYRAKFSYSRSLYGLTLGASIKTLGRDSQLSSFQPPLIRNYTSHSIESDVISLSNFNLHASKKLNTQVGTYNPFVTIKLGIGEVGDLQSSESTDFSLGLYSTYAGLDYQIAYTINGSQEPANLVSGNDIINTFSLSVGKAYQIRGLNDYIFSHVFYFSQNPYQDRIQDSSYDNIMQLGTQVSYDLGLQVIKFNINLGLSDAAPDFSLGLSADF